ncbi:kinesin-like protein KIN-12C [Jatropha curcas]|uniref:kinesin-like protein KIN-12C n=1 Tax=Jatropha curcas TaxID=180498 RepID=UPI0005FBE722|nr:kinesin-like protein KIN-12C [Jatropha curcas]
MSRESSSFRIMARNAHSRNPQDEANENEFDNTLNSAHFPPPRTPLNTIPDPCQYRRETHEYDFDSKDKFETARAGRVSGKKLEAVDRAASYATPRVSNRQGKVHSESNSAQSTPARSGSRASLGGATVAYTAGTKSTYFTRGKEAGSTYRLSRGISLENSDFSVEVPHFELDEDASFWADHNVQVLIRFRPLSNVETISQGYGRCLRQESEQTLVWLGHPETRFTFDHIACETISQEKLFRVVGLPMVENCMSGYNSCMFAYGQTGSGKTYTMMGEINQLEGNISEDCGITPRIFEYLFSRIRMEEESRRNEKLRFSCKCSFLEIYNEQITDLLEPTSTNLQLREDLRKGVYVENLTEYNVKTVNDIIKLLSQGAANRKMAATNMNSESSRSHSVFTCIIESWWEKDSMTHFRFARLNLVDLAGSERQKSSGAEGDRLKEAANINKSLSTLGLVIMSLVDLAHGKHRHVPYRDSRLTFLLQDSLGGNSKTTVIANVSPSMCSAHETLSTLKFAQRAKLIQNNAKVNEDASGDVSTLQRQIQQLKDQLSFVIKHHNLSTSLSSCMPNFEDSRLVSYPQMHNSLKDKRAADNHDLKSIANKKLKCMEATLVGALRREKIAETTLRKLEAEIEQINQFACQREEELKQTKVMLRFRDDKIKQLEFLVDGSLPVDHYLMEENKSLKEEILLLQARIDKNPELTRSALENLELLKQLQLLQNFYEKGERETLLAEISQLREQLLHVLERKLNFSYEYENQDSGILGELEDCRNMNSKLIREVEDLRRELKRYSSCSQAAFDAVTDSFSKDPEEIRLSFPKDPEEIRLSFSKDLEEIRNSDKYSLVETVSAESESGDEMASYRQADGSQKMRKALVIQSSDTQKELMDARSLIKAMESEHAHLIEELQLTQELNCQYMEILKEKNKVEQESVVEAGSECLELQNLEKKNRDLVTEGTENLQSNLQAKLEKLSEDLEQARLLNCQYQKDQASQLSHQHQVNLIHEQVEIETTKTIIHLQEEVTALQLELNEKLCSMTQENMRLRNTLEEKEEEIRVLCGEWERATFELTSFLVEGSKSLEEASGQIESIVCSFPQENVWIREQVEKAAKACIDKEETILWLEKSLEDAQKTVADMELNLHLLKEATMALNEFPLSDNDQSIEEAINLSMLLNEKFKTIKMLESNVKYQECRTVESEKLTDAALSDCTVESEKCADAVFSDCHKVSLCNDIAEMSKMVQSLGLGMEIAEPSYHNARKLVADDKVHYASTFLSKCEEAQATMKEADHTLKVLLKANENANHLSFMWKQSSEELMMARSQLLEENEQLKASLCMKEEENKLLLDEIYCGLVEIANSVSLFERCFQQMQREVDDRYKVLHSDLSSMGKDLLHFICNSRSSLEVIFSEIMEKEFGLFVRYQCIIEKVIQKIPNFDVQSGIPPFGQQDCYTAIDASEEVCSSGKDDILITNKVTEGGKLVADLEEGSPGVSYDSMTHDNMFLKKELERKDFLLKGLLFDFSLLQEAASNRSDIKDEVEMLILALNEVRHELELKTSELDKLMMQYRKVEGYLADTENALAISNSDIVHAKERIDSLSDQNADLRMLLKDLYLKKSEAEEQLEEQKELVRRLEKEIILLTSSVEKKLCLSVEGFEEELRNANNERERFREEICALNDKLQMAYALADENEAVAVEARQESEASKIYAEQKEEEVKILEHSVEELESTINVLERKVHEMDEEVERHRLIRESLERELQALRHRLSTVENFTDIMDSENRNSIQNEDLISSKLKLSEAHNQIRFLDRDIAEKDKEINQLKQYISELVLHSEAQASQYQEKYKTLEAMVREVKTSLSNSASTVAIQDKSEKSSVRTRGSSSPFRCIASLVQQMSLEKDQDLSVARLRIEELEAALTSQQKEVCTLNARLAAAESMTHDVIRDLLGVKLDMTNYANLIDQHQVHKLVEAAHKQTEEFRAKDQEILNLRRQMNDLIEENESCIFEIKEKAADTLGAQMIVEQLKERDQWLSAQNEMLKMDKSNLLRRVAELYEMIKTLLGTESESTQKQIQQTSKTKENCTSRMGNGDFAKRLAHSEKLLSRVNDELAQYRGSSSNHPRVKISGNGLELKHRKQKA